MKYFLVLIINLILCLNAYSDEIYRSRDSNGNYIFSDKKPKTNYKVIDKGDYRGLNTPPKASPEPIPENRSQASIQAKTSEVKKEVDAIYTELFTANKETQGKVIVEFTLTNDGKVTSCQEDESGMVSGGFNGRICEKISTLDYGQVNASNLVEVQHTYNFQQPASTQ